MLAQRVLRRLGVEHQHPFVVAPDVAEAVADPGAFHQREVGRVRDEELALGVREVAHQFVPAVGRVGPDHDSAGEGRRLEPEDELGHVVEHDRDVEGTVLAGRLQPGRPLCGAGHHLGMAEPEIVGHQARARRRRPGPGRHR